MRTHWEDGHVNRKIDPLYFKISGFLHPGKNQTLNGISDSTPRILTLGLPLQICYRRVGVLNLIIVDIGD